MLVGVPKETFPGETRVALVPAGVAQLKKAKLEVIVEKDAGAAAGFLDLAYETAGASIAATRSEVHAAADVILQVRALGANPDGWQADMKLARSGQAIIAVMDALAV